MNIKLADRLVALRKENKLSQEALAEKLGLSRQSISKWERAEASPDTDNLMALAELYGMSLDQLLGNDEPKTEKPKSQEKVVLTENQIKGKKNLLKAPIMFIIAVALYVGGGLIIGGKWWAIMWILFPLTIAYIMLCASQINENKRGVSIALATLSVAMFAVSVYMLLGMLFALWGIAWLVFLAIPAYAYLKFIKK